MIETVMVDELRARLDEQVARSQFKTAPAPADEHVATMLARIGRPDRRDTRGGMTAERARRMAADMAEYDAKAAKGQVEA